MIETTATTSDFLLAQGGRPDVLMIGVFLMLIVFMFFSFRSGQREKKKRQEMLAAIKKNDRVMTLGGVIGTVVNIKDDEIVLKVDETTNTKITFVRGAVQKVLADDERPMLDAK